MQYEMTISPWLLKLSDGRMGFIVLFFVLVLYNTFLNKLLQTLSQSIFQSSSQIIFNYTALSSFIFS